jgi:hypothetical protein
MNESLGINVMLSVFFFVWWKIVWAMEFDSDTRLQEVSNFPS